MAFPRIPVTQQFVLTVVTNALTAVTGWAAGKGYIDGNLTLAIIGLAPSLAAIVFQLVSSTPAATVTSALNQAPELIINQVAKDPNVKLVVTDQQTADAAPSAKVVTSTDAKALL